MKETVTVLRKHMKYPGVERRYVCNFSQMVKNKDAQKCRQP